MHKQLLQFAFSSNYISFDTASPTIPINSKQSNSQCALAHNS